MFYILLILATPALLILGTLALSATVGVASIFLPSPKAAAPTAYQVAYDTAFKRLQFDRNYECGELQALCHQIAVEASKS